MILVIDGGFGPWTTYSDCSTSCGEGIQTRERKCDHPKPKGDDAKDCSVLGSYTETKVCNLKACEKGISYLEQSLALIREMGDRVTESFALTGLGNVYEEQLEDYKTALDFYQQARQIRVELNLQHLVTQMDELIARIQQKMD